MGKLINMINQEFGDLIVVERDYSKKTGAAYWICQCKCGNKKSVRGQNLRNGSVINCGCQKKTTKQIDTVSLIGQVFGRLTVIERDLTKEIGHGKDSFWVCQCECGNKKSIRKSCLTTGKTQS